MGVNFKDLVARKEISIEDLKGKVLAVDGYNTLYQFLTTIRSRDGSVFTDHNGNVTSHLIGLFSRTTKLMKDIKLAFVFDGKFPELKHKELEKRKKAKEDAKEKYESALAENDVEGMAKYAARTSRLTKDMVDDAKRLLDVLGVPWVQAPSEGEAQAAYMVKKGSAWAVASQDYDSLVFGADRLIQNLSIEGRRKVAGTFKFEKVSPTILNLSDVLSTLKLSQDQLIWLAMLIGTDYAPEGCPGIGPKKGLAIVQKASSAKEVFEKNPVENWEEVLNTFKNMPVTDLYDLSWKPIDRSAVHKLLVEKHDFSAERVDSTLDAIAPKKNQKSLGDF